MARRRKGRQVDGLLVLDKPPGVSSNGALQQVKRLYGAAKAGHTGSLDPLATGVLPLCFGEATKFSQFLLNADKGYSVRLCSVLALIPQMPTERSLRRPLLPGSRLDRVTRR